MKFSTIIVTAIIAAVGTAKPTPQSVNPIIDNLPQCAIECMWNPWFNLDGCIPKHHDPTPSDYTNMRCHCAAFADLIFPMNACIKDSCRTMREQQQIHDVVYNVCTPLGYPHDMDLPDPTSPGFKHDFEEEAKLMGLREYYPGEWVDEDGSELGDPEHHGGDEKCKDWGVHDSGW